MEKLELTKSVYEFFKDLRVGDVISTVTPPEYGNAKYITGYISKQCDMLIYRQDDKLWCLEIKGVKALNIVPVARDLYHVREILIEPVLKEQRSVLQDWVQELSFMQQSVLISAVRGPDGFHKDSGVKPIMRWFRRCILISAFDRKALDDPFHPGGGSFTGPLTKKPEEHAEDYFRLMDSIPIHFFLHLMHAAEIVGYKHPNKEIREFWYEFYLNCVNKMHLMPETEEMLDTRLGDNKEQWKARESIKKLNDYMIN